MRINKFIAQSGYCSRRQADRLIEEGKVLINGQMAGLGDQVNPKDRVEVEGKLISGRMPKPVYLAFNKPRGIISSTTDRQGQDVVSYINYPERIYPVGRLDKDTEGLLLLTNDGDLAHEITKTENANKKEYYVVVNKAYDDAFIKAMTEGVCIFGRKTLPAQFKPVDKRTFRLTIRQGLNRQIRRMCEALGYEVTFLRRIRIMNISLGNLQPGEWRPLGYKELIQLQELLERAKAENESSDD